MATVTKHVARIGPNAIIQTIAALGEAQVRDELPALLVGGAEGYLSTSSQEMIAEEEFHALVTLLVARMGGERAETILYRAGERTADYVATNRIPAPARALLAVLPAPISLRLLLPAIRNHAWTFAGSGRFHFGFGPSPWVSIGKPEDRDTAAIASALCSYYCGAFTQLLRRLLRRRVALRESACQARGGSACVYTIVF